LEEPSQFGAYSDAHQEEGSENQPFMEFFRNSIQEGTRRSAQYDQSTATFKHSESFGQIDDELQVEMEAKSIMLASSKGRGPIAYP